MEVTELVVVKEQRRFLGGRALAHDLRGRVRSALEHDRDCTVVLDLSGVEGVSHSFADELLSPLSEWLDEAFADRVILAGCSQDVLDELEAVAVLHGLFMPAVAAGTEGGRPAS